MLVKILVALAVAVVALVVVIATRPAEFRIARSRTVAAPPEAVFPYVNDFHKWSLWSPFEKLDPNMRREFGGAPTGQGADYAWKGNQQAGEGRMTITESRTPARIVIRLEFQKPFAATNTARFDFVPSGSGTTVTWAMTGRNGFMAKAFDLFMNLDSTVGPEFEKGLASLDTVSASAR